ARGVHFGARGDLGIDGAADDTWVGVSRQLPVGSWQLGYTGAALPIDYGQLTTGDVSEAPRATTTAIARRIGGSLGTRIAGDCARGRGGFDCGERDHSERVGCFGRRLCADCLGVVPTLGTVGFVAPGR